MKTGLKFFSALAAVLGILLFDGMFSLKADKLEESTGAVPFQIPGVENAFKVTDRIYSGSQPDGDAAFAELARMGVKTIISVDGSKPDLERARKYGLRYVHLPFGYDGIPAEREAQLAQAGATLPGLIFVHCHHGKHRGPAAVAVLCEAVSNWTPSRAEAWMKLAGTSPDYPGLYHAAQTFKPIASSEIARLGPLPELTQTPRLVDVMVEIDDLFDSLKRSQEANWKASHSADQSTLLREHFQELLRTEETARRPEDYRVKAADGGRASEALSKALHAAPPDFSEAEAAFKQVTLSCAACHKAFRNNNKEK